MFRTLNNDIRTIIKTRPLAGGLGGYTVTQAKPLCSIARPMVARGEGAKISPKGKILLLPNGRQGRRPFEAQERASFACGVAFGNRFRRLRTAT